MRNHTLASLVCLASVAGCGSEPAPPGSDKDLAMVPPDLALIRDFATPPDLTAPPPDLTPLPDLTPAPDLAMDPQGAICGGFIGKPCPNGQFCDYSEACGAADQQGVCRVPPQVCDQIFDPVCGCDGKQYGNDCLRRAGKTSLYNRGICGCQRLCGQGSHCAQCQNGPACVPDGAAC